MMIRLNEDEGHGRQLLWCLGVGHKRKNFRGSTLKFPMPLFEISKRISYFDLLAETKTKFY